MTQAAPVASLLDSDGVVDSRPSSREASGQHQKLR